VRNQKKISALDPLFFTMNSTLSVVVIQQSTQSVTQFSADDATFIEITPTSTIGIDTTTTNKNLQSTTIIPITKVRIKSIAIATLIVPTRVSIPAVIMVSTLVIKNTPEATSQTTTLDSSNNTFPWYWIGMMSLFLMILVIALILYRHWKKPTFEVSKPTQSYIINHKSENEEDQDESRFGVCIPPLDLDSSFSSVKLSILHII
jgi:hypothetical protein